MDVLLPSTIERSQEKRLRMPWSSKTKALTSSSLFNKSKPSDEWHQSIDATAGVLHPSDPKFPWGFIRNHTDIYLKKKGKVNQADADIRLVILIDSHEAKDIAIAAAAHAMTATSLRGLLHVDLNVAQGSYWGLKVWLQSLIAANDGNPAAVTDLEATWARKLLPFATQGARAAEWYLIGASRTLREMSIPNMSILPEFSTLMSRAIADHHTRLEGYRLRNQWSEAYEAVLWMVELAKTSPAVTPPGHLLPEHIFDSQYPVWRLWADWQPDQDRILRFTSFDANARAIMSDLLALEGPDILTGTERTLRDGLIAQYSGSKPLLQYRGLIIQVPNNSKSALRDTLERVTMTMETVCARKGTDPHRQSKLTLFHALLIAGPITTESLDVLDATISAPNPHQEDIYGMVRHIYVSRNHLGGEDIAVLHALLRFLESSNCEDLRGLLFRSWLFTGIEKCVSDCRAAVRSQIDNRLPWIDLALELHSFCSVLRKSKHRSGLSNALLKDFTQLPTPELMRSVLEIFQATESCDSGLNEIDSSNRKSMIGPAAVTQIRQLDNLPKTPSTRESSAKDLQHPLKSVIEAFCIDRLLQPGIIERVDQQTMTIVLHIWEVTAGPTIDFDRRELAVFVTKLIEANTTLWLACLSEIATGQYWVPTESFARDLKTILLLTNSGLSKAIIALTQLLCAKNVSANCWKDLLLVWIGQQASDQSLKGMTVLEDSLSMMKAADWIAFMNNIKTLFSEYFNAPSTTKRSSTPPILQPDLLAWISQITEFTHTLTRLDFALGANREPTRIILARKLWTKNVLTILGYLRDVEGKPAEELMQKIVGQLNPRTKNDWDIRECCIDLANAQQDLIDACYKIWDTFHGSLLIPGLSSSAYDSYTGTAKNEQRRYSCVPIAVVEVMLAGLIQDETIPERQKVVFQSLAKVLQVDVHHLSVPIDKLNIATTFWQKVEEDIIKEAERLEGLQKALTKRDPKGTALLLQELGIPDDGQLDEEIAKLPAGISDFIEKTGDAEVEISFPIASFTELRRNAMGVPREAKTLLVRLSVDFTGGSTPLSFCVHFDNEQGLESLQHRQWTAKKDTSAPQNHVCTSNQTAFVWQTNRILHMQLRDGDISLVELYKRVSKRLEQIGEACISCGVSHQANNAQLRRATPCNLLACAQLWYQLPLDVRIPEIRTDLFAVDVMLMSVHAAAMSGRQELLAGCPIRSIEAVKVILNSLPKLTVISHAVNISTVLKTYHQDAEKLISWACVHHRGYIATATGVCKVPTMPNVHQFVLANARPKLESEFMAKIPRQNPKTTVLFHGTTFDRLPAILSQGLRVCSGTHLQRTGAAHGKGIYLAEDPATSLTYAPTTMSWKNSSLSNTRLLLGCEIVGNGRNVSSTIHVVTDEASVMVRYIFLLPLSVSAPLANHIVPAMASGMSALRSGVV